mmetsp:Transcript_21790/g.25706  ORF Transcript_21790/g.25706 Transcript_21790/m.25706 type:complete len:124 (-) Transcript_21790:113-484(-)
MALAIHEFINKDIGEHTFHGHDPWPNEERKDVMFYAFPQQVKGTEPVWDFWNPKDKEHTFHMAPPLYPPLNWAGNSAMTWPWASASFIPLFSTSHWARFRAGAPSQFTSALQVKGSEKARNWA